MGKPATAYFCKNGHLHDQSGHHEYCDTDLLFESEYCKRYVDPTYSPKEILCKFCGKKLCCVLEWGDFEYDQVVPTEPIGKDSEGRNLYDVSGIFEKEGIKNVSS